MAASPSLPSLCTYNWDSICQGLLDTKSPFKRFCVRAVVTAAPAQGLILSLWIVLTAGLGSRWDSVSDSSQTVLLKFPLLKCSLSISLYTVLSTSQYQQAWKFQWCQRDLYLSEAEENPWEFSEAFYLSLPAIIFYARNIIGEEKGRWHQLLSRKISRRNDTHCGTERYFTAAGSSLGSENSTCFQGWTQISHTTLRLDIDFPYIISLL